jgi:hypothetical protein
MTCLICYIDGITPYALPPYRTQSGYELRPAANCMNAGRHVFCEPCLRETVKTNIASRRVHDLRCPAPGCTTLLFDPDVERLLQTERDTLVQYRDEVQRMHTATAADMTHEDVSLLRELACLQIKSCPRCRALIERSSGCDLMYCVCGHNFNFRQAEGLVPRALLQRMSMAGRFGWTLEYFDSLGFRAPSATPRAPRSHTGGK